MKLFVILLSLVVVLPGLAACISSAVYTSRVEKRFPPIGQIVDNNGKDIHVIEQGIAAGPVVFMIHGASANAREFTGTLAPRLKDTHRILMADRPGHGYSGRPTDARTLGVQAAQMAVALEALAPGEKATIVGHSFGGAVALRLALDRPDLVEALVLLAPVSHDWGSDSQAWYTKIAARPLLGPIFTQLVPLVGTGQLEEGIVGVFHPESAPENYVEISGSTLLFRPSEFRANARDVSILRAELGAQEGRYNELKIPITLYAGLRDTVIKPERHAGKLKQQVPLLNVIELPNGGHMPHHAHSAAIAETIRALSTRANSE